MKPKTNPFQAPLDQVFKRVNHLYGLLFLLNNQLKNLEGLLREALAKQNRDISTMAVGTALVIRDLTEWPDHGWAVYYPSGKFGARDEKYFEMIQVIISRESAWAISQGYEAFETYLRDIVALYLFQNPRLADEKRLQRFKNDPKSSSLSEDALDFWRAFSPYAFQANKDLLRFVRRVALGLQEAEGRNNRAINLLNWYEVLTKVREAATHSEFVVKNERMRAWTEENKSILVEFFPGTYTSAGYSLMLKPDNAEKALQLLAEYAFSIFKYISTAQTYEWQIFPKGSNENAV